MIYWANGFWKLLELKSEWVIWWKSLVYILQQCTNMPQNYVILLFNIITRFLRTVLTFVKIQITKMCQLTMYCYLRPPNVMHANLKCFAARDINDRILMVSFTFTLRRHLIRLASAPFTSFRLGKFGWIAFAELHLKRLTTTQNTDLWRVGKNFRPILSRLWTKFMQFSDDVEDPSHFFDALARLSISSFVQKIIAITSRSRRKPNIYIVFGPNFFGRNGPISL